jgi:hypothetical protein
MALTAPDWLKQHDGGLRQSSDGHTWLVLFHDHPQYLVRAVPAAGKFGALVKQTINGHELDSKGRYASEEEALRGGLEDLRNALG